MIEKAKYSEAIQEFTKAGKLSGGNSEPLSMTGYAWAKAGDLARARAALQELKSLSVQRYVPASHIAMLSGVLQEKDEAMTWLEQSYADRDLRLCRLKAEPKWDPMRSDPRFIAFLKRLGLE